MSEFLKNLVSDKRARVAAAIFGLGLTTAACSNTSVESQNAQIIKCGGLDGAIFSRQGSSQPITSVRSLINQASRDVSILHRRSQLADGRIDLPRYSGITEVTSSSDSLTLTFPSQQEIMTYADTLTFDFQNNKPAIEPGSIVCQSDGQIYPNQGFTSLQPYVDATGNLEKLAH